MMDEPLRDIPILTYHKIDMRREWGINSVKPGSFLRQMQLLKEEGYTPVNFRQIHQGEIPAKPIIITFDDGYESVYDNAFPILRKSGFTAVVFIITEYIGKMNLWDANLGGIRFSHLNRRQIGELSDAGIEIGSHGIAHRAFTHITPEELEAELYHSRRELQKLCGTYPLSLAYPFGMQNHSVLKLVRKAGYEYGCINLWGATNLAQPLSLSRIPVYRTDSLRAFRNKLTKGWRNRIEISKLKMLSWPSRLTPLYQDWRNRTWAPHLSQTGYRPEAENIPEEP
ncbi:MAG: polysaccharide deacetylase family protein [Calditrichia bacterium]